MEIWSTFGLYAVAVAIIAVVAVALVQIIRDKALAPVWRVGWVVAVVVAPLIGSLAWFAWNGLARDSVSRRARRKQVNLDA